MTSLLSFYEGDSYLHRRNPALKLLCAMVMVLAVTLAFDPWTPLVFLVLGGVVLRLLGGVPLRRLPGALVLIVLVGGLGLVAANALFYAAPAGSTPRVLWTLGKLRVTAEGLRVGVSLALRMLAIVLYSLIYVATTDPTDLILSLIQQACFPFRLGYGVLVAYRFLPLWRSELQTIRAAHRVRGVGERAGLRGRWQELRRYALPLLAGAIRKAERVAIAMDSKAFGALPQHTYYRRLKVVAADWVMLASSLVLTVGLLVGLGRAGLLAGFGVVPAA